MARVFGLAVYDTAPRIGARLGLEPEKVYVHAGTRDGARALGFDGWRQAIEMDELPAPSGDSPRARPRTCCVSTRADFGERA